MTVIGVVAPMRSELRPFVRAAGLERSGDRFGGRVGRYDVVATTCGVGMERAARTAGELIANDHVDRVVVIGIAGGVDTSLPIATVIRPEVVVDGVSGPEYRPDHWGTGAPRGRIATFDDFETEMEVMHDLRHQGVTAVDMETAAVVQVCEARGVPCSVFRAVSDDATDGSVDAATADMLRPDGTPDVKAALRYLLRRPWRIPRLARLGRDANRAAKAAARAALEVMQI